MVNISYLEDRVSQIPALRLLIAMGWQYLPPAQVDALRGGRASEIILTGVLKDWLRSHNAIQVKGRSVPFSESNLDGAINALKDVPLQKGLIPASEELYQLLTLGKSFLQEIDGDRRSYDLNYIDWQHPANNVYHVTDEFVVERRGSHQTRRPDIVLFVNGIPLVVIECKRPDKQTSSGEKAVYEGVSQMLRNQRVEDEIPHLFVYAQLLMAISTNDALYAATGTPKKFWATWQDEEQDEAALSRLINAPLTDDEKTALYGWRDYGGSIRHYFESQDAAGDRLPSAQDRMLAAMLSPERLLELAYQFIVYDGGQKKIARYQQYFAIKATLRRIREVDSDGVRAGGVIWHTTGSGKSLTMVMLAKALALVPGISNRRVVIVTDRIDLDNQIWGTFKACRETVYQADSGAHLAELIRAPKHNIITTVIDKFEAAARSKLQNSNPDIFVLVDESHRSQYGSSHAKMREVFPKGCYIGFTGTPLLKREKRTADRFGGFIHKYTMRQAVLDGAVVPLIYEGRIVDLDVDHDKLDTWFERRTAELTEDQKTDLKRKMSRAEEVHNTHSRMQAIAWDIAQHYKKTFRGQGYKGQLATSSREQALAYRDLLLEEGIRCEVVMSAPDTREGNDDIDESSVPRVTAFWNQMMKRYGNADAYVREVKKSFKEEDGFEIVIVVDMLLVGFDEPRNTVLYIDKSLREHGLLQAIARVNRLYEGKDFGYVIDYRGVLGQLNEALETYNALEEYDAEDVDGTITDISAVLADLPGAHEHLRALFNPVNLLDREAVERYLEPEDRRQQFYDALHNYARLLKVALSTIEFYQQTSEARIQQYKKDLTFFHSLRQSVQLRYAETVEYGDYEQKIRKLLNDHVQADAVNIITPEVNIFDEKAFAAAVEHLGTPAARADAIASRIKKTATERVEQDPAFYRKFSQLVEDTIEVYKSGRISELEYLNQMEAALDEFRIGHSSDLPQQLIGTKDAPAYYGLLNELFTATDRESTADLAVAVERQLNRVKVRDWVANPDVINRMKGVLDDLLYEFSRHVGVKLDTPVLDALIDQIVEVAKNRDAIR
jgi:type I restriction enzyme, R subunit